MRRPTGSRSAALAAIGALAILAGCSSSATANPTQGAASALAPASSTAPASMIASVPPVSASASVAPATSAATIQVPPAIATAGKLVFCSDISFPPMELYDSNNQPIGADIDIGKAVAAQLGVTAEFDQTGFDGIIAALESQKCDAIISGMNDTAQREQAISFVHYMQSGSVFLVPKGDPLGIHSELDVCGHAAGGQVGSSNYAVVTTVSQKCVTAGKPAIQVVAFKEDPLGVTALVTGQVDAYETDAAPAAYYISKNPNIQVGVDNIDVQPIAMGVPKNDQALQTALKQAVANLYADGTMQTILTKWNLSKYGLPSGG
jgi:polar amino acid transport system substrate-binding protein